jgi:hypothetical protein
MTMLSVVYKSARTAPYMYLMYRCSTTQTGCPGAVAAAFLHLAQQLKGAPVKYRCTFPQPLPTCLPSLQPGCLGPSLGMAHEGRREMWGRERERGESEGEER